MGDRLSDPVTYGQPDSAREVSYPLGVATDTKIVLRDNVRELLLQKTGSAGVAALINLGVSNGNAQRVLGGVTSVGLNVVEQVAAALGVQTWQLLTPGLGAAAAEVPPPSDVTAALGVIADQLKQMTSSQRAEIAQQMQTLASAPDSGMALSALAHSLTQLSQKANQRKQA